MTLSELSIKRPVFAWMIMAFFVIFGILAYSRLGISLLPDVDFPVLSISLSLNGAAPEVIENQVVDIIEDAVMQIEGIRTVTSSSKQSNASISIEFEINKDIDVAIQEVQSKIASIQKSLPENLDPPAIKKSNPEDQPIIWLVITGTGNTSMQQVMEYARNTLVNQFATISGVADINMGGYVDPSLRVWASADKLNRYELTVPDIVKSLQSEHLEVPAGLIEKETKNIPVRIIGEAHTVSDFENLPISFRGGRANYRLIKLKDLAKVEDGLSDVRRAARYNGQVAMGLGILKQHGSNAVEVSKQVREKLAEVNKTLPKEYKLELRMDSSKNISDSVHEMLLTLVFSILLTSLVCFLFLGNWSSTFNVLLAIPTSIIGTFIAIYFFGFTLNTFTILGLSLAIGIVVDDAIMMLENIMRYIEMGHSRVKASLLGASEITFAAIAATIAIIAIFVPVIFMKGAIGRYLYQYGITVAFAVILSLLEALTLTPMRCSHFLTPPSQSRFSKFLDTMFEKLMVGYQKILKVVLRFKYLTLIVAVVIFGISILIVKKIPSEMIPAQDQSMFLLRVKAPVGASLPYTQSKFKIIEEYLQKQKEISGVYASVGGFGGDQVNEGAIMISLIDKKNRELSQTDMMEKIGAEFKDKIKGVKVIPQDMSMRGFSSSRGFPIEFGVTGPSWEKLMELSNQFIDELNKSGIVTDVNSDVRRGMKEIHIYPNRAKASARGVSIKSLSQVISSMVGGVTLGSSTRYAKGGHRYDINVRLLADERSSQGDLDLIKVRNNRGELVPIKDVVDVKEEEALQSISRRDRERSVGIFGNVGKGHSQNEALKFVQESALKFMPPGYRIVMSGAAQSFKESFQSLIFALVLGIVISYMVLASQFNSFIHPISILIALPFSITGAFLGLFIFHQSLNIFSLIGIILLMGIAKKNSILLVEFTNHKRTTSDSITEAILEACPIRLRPILMTSFATIAGAIPAALALGPGAETRVPMAIAIIGGIIISTMFTLLVVPCLYSILVPLEKKKISSTF